MVILCAGFARRRDRAVERPDRPAPVIMMSIDLFGS